MQSKILMGILVASAIFLLAELPEGPKLDEVMTKFNQDHLIKHLATLPAEDAAKLMKELKCIDFDMMSSLFKKLVAEPGKMGSALPTIEPMKNIKRLRDIDEATKNSLRNKGLHLIAEGKVGVLMLSGGQGSRLGFNHAKGMYDIGLPSKKTLFQIFAERIRRVNFMAASRSGADSEKSCGRVKWYLMTSETNDAEIRDFFKSNKYFGLAEEDLFFFQQDSLPAMDLEGKVMLEAKDKVFFAPNGNGGLYLSLKSSGALEDMEKRGISLVHMVGVDNILSKLADPLFLAFAQEGGFEITGKFVAKRDPKESVGVFVLKNGKPDVIEYSEIGEEMAKELNEKGELKYNEANIVNVIYTTTFLKRVVNEGLQDLLTEFHVAKKKIPHYDITTGNQVAPTTGNGYKFEVFFFDIFKMAKSMGLLETVREEEFAPVKNAPGTKEDSPDTAREIISKLHYKWLKSVGVTFEDEASGEPSKCCEISSLLSYEGEDLDKLQIKEKVKLPRSFEME